MLHIGNTERKGERKKEREGGYIMSNNYKNFMYVVISELPLIQKLKVNSMKSIKQHG